MARTVKQLTVTQINNAKSREKVYYLSDGQGLRLAIRPNGTKTWLFNYTRPYLKTRTDKTIGAYPDVSLADARAKAQEYREYLAKNLDPHTVEQEKGIIERNKLTNTFAAVAREWLVYREKIGKEQKNYSERTRIDTTRRVNGAIEVIGEIPFDQITLKHGLAVLEPFRAAGALFELKKRYLVLKMIAEYAERFGYWEKNVWRYLGADLPTPPKDSHHAAIRYKDLPDFLQTLRQARLAYSSLLAILWGLLNVTRASETVSAKLDDIVEMDGMLVWFVKVSKGGKGEREHLVPLSKQAQTLLRYAKKQARQGYLFPAVKRTAPLSHLNAQTPNDVIKTMAGGKFKGVMTNHGIRTVFSSYCNDNRLELGLDKDVIEICLSHLDSDKVRNAYNRAEYLPYRLKTFQAWADYVEECARGLFDELRSDLVS